MVGVGCRGKVRLGWGQRSLSESGSLLGSGPELGSCFESVLGSVLVRVQVRVK